MGSRVRELFKLFTEIGFEEVTVHGFVAPIDCAHQGSEYFDYNYGKLKLFVREESGFMEMVDAGLLSQEQIETAREEIEDWYADPHAFALRPEVLVAGRVV